VFAVPLHQPPQGVKLKHAANHNISTSTPTGKVSVEHYTYGEEGESSEYEKLSALTSPPGRCNCKSCERALLSKTNKQTPCPLIGKRTIPTEQSIIVGEI
jgi:hypothetical protein